MATVKWRKHPVLEDVLMRRVTQEDLADEAREEEDEERRRLDKQNRRWLRPIPLLEWPRLERLASRTYCGLGGEIVDCIRNTTGIVKMHDGREYAVRRMDLYVQFEVEDGKGTKGMSDCISVVLYRDPDRPKRLRLVYGQFLKEMDVQKEVP